MNKKLKLQLLYDGKEYDKLYLDLISNASKSIVLHTYIFNMDSFGKSIFEALIAASKRGVKI